MSLRWLVGHRHLKPTSCSASVQPRCPSLDPRSALLAARYCRSTPCVITGSHRHEQLCFLLGKFRRDRPVRLRKVPAVVVFFRWGYWYSFNVQSHRPVLLLNINVHVLLCSETQHQLNRRQTATVLKDSRATGSTSRQPTARYTVCGAFNLHHLRLCSGGCNLNTASSSMGPIVQGQIDDVMVCLCGCVWGQCVSVLRGMHTFAQ